MKQYWKIGLALAVIFIAGGGFGFTVGKGVDAENVEERQEAMKKPEGWAQTMMLRMEGSLRLTEEQKAEIRPKLRESARQLYLIRRKATREQFEAIQNFYAELEPILTDEQRERLEQARNRSRQRIEQLQKQIREGIRPPSPVIR